MEENRKESKKRFGKIIYSKSFYKNSNKNPLNYYPISKDSNSPSKNYDNIVNKAKNTIEKYKKQIYDEDYFNNAEFYNNQIKNQLIKFKNGQTDYRYYSPSLSEKNNSQIPKDLNNFRNINNNKNNRYYSAQKKNNNNNIYNHNSNQVNKYNNKYNNYFNDIINENNKGDNNNAQREINLLRKRNIENEKIIMENSKEKIDLVHRIKELENIINNDYPNIKNRMSKNRRYGNENNDNMVILNRIIDNENTKEKEKDNQIKQLKNDIKQYTNIIEDQNKKIQIMQKDYDLIQKEKKICNIIPKVKI